MNQSNRRGTPASTPSSDGWPCREPPGVDSRCPSPPNWVAQRCCGSDDGGAGKGAIQGGGEGAIQGRGEGRRATVQERGEGTMEGGAVRLMRWRGKARPVIRVRASSGAIGFGW